MSATIPADTSYFGERLKAARSQLVQAWGMRSAKLEPRYHYTDIIGALLLAGQIFDQRAGIGQKMLVIYSDMRQSTPNLNLELPKVVPSFSRIKAGHMLRIADLLGVHVFIQGVDGAGETIAYWRSLKDFRDDYFVHCRSQPGKLLCPARTISGRLR